eukprot:PhF_6_TR13022/c0_g1_i1/m.20650/K11252/H2B; histone H2B
MPSKSGKRPMKGGKAKSAKAKGFAKQPPKSGGMGGGPGGRGTRKPKRNQRWGGFIHKVLHQVHEDLAITTRGMKIMACFVEDMFDRIYTEAIAVSKLGKTKTMSARELQTAARLLLPGELAKHAMSEGTKAVAKYASTVQQQKDQHKE